MRIRLCVAGHVQFLMYCRPYFNLLFLLDCVLQAMLVLQAKFNCIAGHGHFFHSLKFRVGKSINQVIIFNCLTDNDIMQFTFLINWGIYACCFNIKTQACNVACRLRHLWLLCMLEGWGVAQHLHSNLLSLRL